MNRFKEKISLFAAKKPRKTVLITILLINLVFIALSAGIISALSVNIRSVQNFGFWESVFYTISMILDAGCIQYVVEDVGQAGTVVIIVCLLVVILGMILFTGAVIGYITDYISDFIRASGEGRRRLRVSGHIVILNWNSRASEIVNDLLYSENAEKVVVLVPDRRLEVEKEIFNRLEDTLERENRGLMSEAAGLPLLERAAYIRKHRVSNRLSVIVREGNAFATKDLNDICLDRAKTVIILGRDTHSIMSGDESGAKADSLGRGNTVAVKTLIQVAEITSADTSADNQKIVVEVEDDWTLGLVNQITAHKERAGNCEIVPVPVNRILGQLLSQFSIMPELNRVYGTLFSNRGAFFTSRRLTDGTRKADEDRFLASYLNSRGTAVPLTLMETRDGLEAFYMVHSEADVEKSGKTPARAEALKLNPDFRIGRKNIVILGHNTRMLSLMDGFDAFRREWNPDDGSEILNIMMIDDAGSLKKHHYYKQYPYVSRVVEADIFDKDTINSAILEFSRSSSEDTSVLILSDDLASREETDANALTYLIYVQHIIDRRLEEEPGFRPEQLDIIVEVLDAKNYDVVKNYRVNNVVISNRYISKMITQTGSKESIFDFYNDILTYDDENTGTYESKELYIKKVRDFLEEIPGKRSAEQLIRGVFEGSPSNNRAILLGYVRNEKDYVLFDGAQADVEVELTGDDKLIIFSNH